MHALFNYSGIAFYNIFKCVLLNNHPYTNYMIIFMKVHFYGSIFSFLRNPQSAGFYTFNQRDFTDILVNKT